MNESNKIERDKFEYKLLFWDPSDAGAEISKNLNVFGAQGWELVSFAPRGAQIPMSGMGAATIPEMVFAFKRRKK